MRRKHCCAAVVAALCAASAHADVIDTRGMAPHEQCAYCHGLDGNSASPRFPQLAGQSVSYIKKQLGDFKHGRRTNDEGAMSGIAETLSESDVDTIAQHFASQKVRAAKPAATAGDYAAGERLYFHGRRGLAPCASCHGTTTPVRADAPRLMGQHGAYLTKQLTDFRRGARRNDDGGMRRVARSLGASEMGALVAFLSREPVMTGASR
jgi:cytochrome c553